MLITSVMSYFNQKKSDKQKRNMKAPYKLLVLTTSMISFLITGYSKNNYTRVKNLALKDCEQ